MPTQQDWWLEWSAISSGTCLAHGCGHAGCGATAADQSPSELDQEKVSPAHPGKAPLWGEMPTPPVPGTTSRAAHGRTFQGVWESHGCVSLWRVGEGPQNIPPTSTLGVLALQGAEDPHVLTLHGLPGSGYREVLADYPIPLGCFSPSITHQEPASRQQGAISLPCPPQSHPF